MAEVVLERVSKVFPGRVRAVNGISLTVANGEFVVVVGPSGCGKSTTLRLVAGLEELTSGTVRIAGEVVNDVPPRDRDIAMVFQNYALYPHMTVYENMALGLRLRKVDRAETDRKVRNAAGLLGIERLLERRPKDLSGGERQRVAVGRAIVRDPKAFLLDEPLSNLDARLRMEMRGELKKLHRRLETTTIYVTHDQEEAMTLGDRVLVMKDGQVHQSGSPLDVYEHPRNRFVAGFMGTPPMNLLDGRICSENGRLYFDEGSCKIRVPDSFADRLGRYVGRSMTLGVRPEDISPRTSDGCCGEENTTHVTVSVVELLGDRMDVYVRTPSHGRIVSRVDAHSGIREGMELTMHLNMSRVHFFEPGETGVSVSHNGHGASASAN
jgi:multiple sugar transport system ATP-binding protein